MTMTDGTRRLDERLKSHDLYLGALMAEVQAGDRKSYAALLAVCVPVIREKAIGAGVRDPVLESVLRETLTTLHHARRTYDPTRSFTAWLTAIAERLAFASIRAANWLPLTDRRQLP